MTIRRRPRGCTCYGERVDPCPVHDEPPLLSQEEQDAVTAALEDEAERRAEQKRDPIEDVCDCCK